MAPTAGRQAINAHAINASPKVAHSAMVLAWSFARRHNPTRPVAAAMQAGSLPHSGSVHVMPLCNFASLRTPRCGPSGEGIGIARSRTLRRRLLARPVDGYLVARPWRFAD